MMSVRSFLHLTAALHFCFGCLYDWNFVKIPTDNLEDENPWGPSGKLRFLTFWDALLQTFFFTICLINDLFGSNEYHPKRKPFIRRIKDLLLASLAFPIAMFVGSTFWSLYFIDRELVFPKALDAFFPVWLNHVMHTNIMIFILIEMLTSFREYPSRKCGLSILILFKLSYLIWIHIIHDKTGTWVYPVLEVLPLPGRIVFFAGCLALAVGLYIAGEKINNIYWRKELKIGSATSISGRKSKRN